MDYSNTDYRQGAAAPTRRALTDAGEDAGEDAATLADRGALADAMLFLWSLLADGPQHVWELREGADGAGHSWRPMVRAKAALGAHAFKENGNWRWTLAPAAGSDGAQV